MTDVFNSIGQRITLGHKLGRGGEGAVYEVPMLGKDVAAKVYHEAISPEKQEKLRSMVKRCDEPLKKIAAWPIETLHKTAGGQICGFLMPRVVGGEPIHHLYGPSHRKQRYPDKDWAFLVNAARNVSAAFDAIHAHGHVIGDVNPELVFVTNNSTVKLIDCDSFQVAAEGKHYLCEVGVAHFTPPELLEHKTFHGLRRTKNHDNFGLALLVFHTLLMGRHPFSGVFSGSGDMPLEKSIAQFRYAFGQNASSKRMSPPPNSISPAILPNAVRSLFERAFTEHGAQPDGRPTAREWVVALDSLKSGLRTCGQEPMHKYFGGLEACPWCAQEQKSGTYFFISHITDSPGLSSFSLGKIWAQITSIESPGSAPEINTTGTSVQPKPLPPEVRHAMTIAFMKKVAAVVIVVGCLVVWPKGFWLALIVGGGLFFATADVSAERRKRQQAHKVAVEDMNALLARFRLEAGDAKFHFQLKECSKLRAEYESLPNQLAQEKQTLQQNIRQSQLHKFLDGFFLENYSVAGVGATRKATLASFGVETAADITWNKVIQIKGFGPALTNSLIDWRKSIERRFVFDQSKGVDPADIAALNHRFAQKRKNIEGVLLAGPEQLIQMRRQTLQLRAQMIPTILAAAQRVAQAAADLSIMQ